MNRHKTSLRCVEIVVSMRKTKYRCWCTLFAFLFTIYFYSLVYTTTRGSQCAQLGIWSYSSLLHRGIRTCYILIHLTHEYDFLSEKERKWQCMLSYSRLNSTAAEVVPSPTHSLSPHPTSAAVQATCYSSVAILSSPNFRPMERQTQRSNRFSELM